MDYAMGDVALSAKEWTDESEKVEQSEWEETTRHAEVLDDDALA